MPLGYAVPLTFSLVQPFVVVILSNLWTQREVKMGGKKVEGAREVQMATRNLVPRRRYWPKWKLFSILKEHGTIPIDREKGGNGLRGEPC
jgi:hypothetical protein